MSSLPSWVLYVFKFKDLNCIDCIFLFRICRVYFSKRPNSLFYFPLEQMWFENGLYDVDIVFRNLKSENSQDYDQKPQRNCTPMNPASGKFLRTYPGPFGIGCSWGRSFQRDTGTRREPTVVSVLYTMLHYIMLRLTRQNKQTVIEMDLALPMYSLLSRNI